MTALSDAGSYEAGTYEAGSYTPAAKAKTPAASPVAAPLAIISSIGLLGLAVVAGREFLIERNAISGKPWIRNTFEWISRLSWQNWMWPASIAALVLGSLLLLAVLKPRAKTHLAGKDEPVLWLRPTDAARLSTAAALQVPGVLSARTTVGKRKAAVRVATDSDDTGRIAESVRAQVGNELEALDKSPKVKVSIAKGSNETGATQPVRRVR